MSALSVNATSHALVWLIVPPPSHHHICLQLPEAFFEQLISVGHLPDVFMDAVFHPALWDSVVH